MFEDINVEKMVIDQLRMMEVNVDLGFEFYGIDGSNSCKGIRFSFKKSYEIFLLGCCLLFGLGGNL